VFGTESTNASVAARGDGDTPAAFTLDRNG
jgi:hypothetical protein